MTVGRRLALGGAAAGLVVPRARAAPRKRIYMLLWRGWEEACDGFRDYLSSRGVDADYIVRDAGQSLTPVEGFVREVNETRPDLVFVWGGSNSLAALGRWDNADPRRHITEVPCVLAIVADPLGLGIVRSLKSPGRNVTGTIYVAPVEVQLRAIQAYRPSSRIATLFNPNEASSRDAAAQLGELTRRGGLQLLEKPVPLDATGRPEPDALPGMVGAFKQAGAEWLYIPPDTFLNDYRDALTEAALEQHLPAFSATERFVTYASGLAGLVCRYYNIGRFAGFKAEQILVGGRPASSIPVETLTRFTLLIRMTTAQRLDFYPPLALLRYAEAV